MTTYAYQLTDRGPSFCGSVVDAGDGMVRMHVASAILLHAGYWEYTDEFRLIRRCDCRCYGNRKQMLAAMWKRLDALYPRRTTAE